MAITGFDAAEMEDLFKEKTSGKVKEDHFDADKAAAEIETPVSRRGDVWLLGKHRLMCGDNTSAADVKILMDGSKARCVFTDPPWNVDYGSDAKHPSWKPRQILNDKMSTEQFGAFLLSAFKCMAGASEPGCMVYVAMSAQEWGNMMPAMREAGYQLVKHGHLGEGLAGAFPQRLPHAVRTAVVRLAGRDGRQLCPLKDRKQSDLWQIPRPKVSAEHPTMKPVALVAKALLNSSRTGDTVLDLFGGSGTTLIASEQTERICRMMELDAKYCDVIIRRYTELAGGDAEVYLLWDGKRTPYAKCGQHLESEVQDG